MTEFEQLMNASDENQFFILLCNFLGKNQYTMPQEIRARDYEDMPCLSLTIDQRMLYYRGDTLVLQPISDAHQFILTSSNQLIWIIAGEEHPLRGLDEIKKRFEELRQGWEYERPAPPPQLENEELRRFLEG